MDRDAAMAVTGLDRARMGVETRIFREQRRVDVEHPSLPAGHEFGAEDAHVSGENDILRPGLHRGPLHDGIVVRARHAAVGKGEGRHALGRGQRKPLCIGIVGRDEADLAGTVRQQASIEQRGHIAAAP